MMKVLIIDDEEAVREGLRIAIDWTSMECEIVGEAEDGDEGIKLIESLKPDIIITDIRMPGLDGLQMISKIKELQHNCKIIIITGFRDFDYAQEAVRLGAFRFILKPTKTNEINEAIIDAVKDIKKQKSQQQLFVNMQNKIKEYYGLTPSNSSTHDNNTDENPNNSQYIVSLAIKYMKTNYSKELTLKSVSDKLYISTWYLSKLIKKETGNTFVDILNEIRIQESKKLLKEPKYKIYEIAELVGFTDVPYFTKLFKKVTGITPMEYRNNGCN